MKSKPRILLVADPGIPVPPSHYGGIERIVDFLLNQLSHLGYEVYLAGHADSQGPFKELISLGRSPASKLQRYVQALRFLQTVHYHKIDIIHSFAHLDYLIPHWPFSIPKIISLQSLPFKNTLEKRLKIVPHRNLFFTTCGHHMLKKLPSNLSAYGIHNAVPVGKYTFQPKVSNNAPFVFLGRLEFIKGVHHAIAVAKAIGRKLVIAGNISPTKDAKDYFLREVDPNLSDEIKYIGPVDDQQKNELLGSAAALLMPIEWEEPFGIVMAEALACGTPVIGFARGALPEIVEDRVTGAVCNNMIELIKAASVPDRYSREACRQAAVNRFSYSVIVKHYENLYERALSSN